MTSRVGDNSSQLALRNDHPQALIMGQLGVFSLEQHENSGGLAELERATNAWRFSDEFLPESHPTKPVALNRLGTCSAMRFE